VVRKKLGRTKRANVRCRRALEGKGEGSTRGEDEDEKKSGFALNVVLSESALDWGSEIPFRKEELG